MKIVFFFLILFFGTAKPGYSKEELTVSSVMTITSKSLPGANFPGGDDDPPIIIERTKKDGRLPVANSFVVFYNGVYTVQGYTDYNGEIVIQLPEYGTWNIHITHEDYQTIDAVMEITQPISTRTDTLISK